MDCDVKWTCSRLGPMFVYKNYLTWNSIRIFTKSHPKCTNHFRKDWTINRVEITHKSLYNYVNIVMIHFCLNHCVMQFLGKRKITLNFFYYNFLFCLFPFSSNAASSYIPSSMSFKMVVLFKVGFIRPMYKVWDKNEMVKQTSPILKRSH